MIVNNHNPLAHNNRGITPFSFDLTRVIMNKNLTVWYINLLASEEKVYYLKVVQSIPLLNDLSKNGRIPDYNIKN